MPQAAAESLITHILTLWLKILSSCLHEFSEEFIGVAISAHEAVGAGLSPTLSRQPELKCKYADTRELERHLLRRLVYALP